ncbi:MAG: hypothetical protein GXP27_13835 [Planctomycetes bacterium]|nr:hypothetical protein [Planctomycetota bacterium]
MIGMAQRMRLLWLAAAVFASVAGSLRSMAQSTSGNLVFNGGFERDVDRDGVPDGWRTSGRRQIRQALTLDQGHDGGHAAKLQCTRYVGGTPDSHAMICQVGQVGLKRGQWYRLRFWAKGRGIVRQTCDVAVSNTQPWYSSGVGGRFVASDRWRRVEILSRAERDVPAETSRLQFWFRSTGTLWLDDVVLEPVQINEQLHPTIATNGVTNPIPNSSFECGSAGWGSYSTAITAWSGNLNRLVGTVDQTTAAHGQCSLRIRIDKRQPIVYHWDYFDPVVQPVLSVQAAHFGWIPVEPGRPYVLSCYAKANRPNVPVRLMAYQHEANRPSQIVRVDTEWKRYTLVFTPKKNAIWIAAGPDLTQTSLGSATVWLDAFQLDAGRKPRPFVTRATVESTVDCPDGPVSTEPNKGLTVELRVWNGTDQSRHVRGRLSITDFFDREVFTRRIACDVAAGRTEQLKLSGLLSGRRGFFRIRWQPTDHRPPFDQTLRCAIIDPYPDDESPFGMNHAYPWDFLLQLGKAAGLLWMRDWSAKWHTVEPEPNVWDFSKVDPQIARVLATGLRSLILLPFPSTPWSSAADPGTVQSYAGNSRYLRKRAIVACPPKDFALFREYVSRIADRYHDRVSWFEIMNEPLYTTYAVPARFGYRLDDYLAILKSAYQAIKETAPEAKVIGGIGTWVEQGVVQRFIDADGLRWCDAMDIHLYPVTIDPELYEPDLAATWRKMQSRGQAKPIWLTEFGCYADDDPYRTPSRIGDSAMSRANWPDEQAASEALVQTAAVFLTHGVRKIFFHAGTCGAINGRNGGSVFFEYGGAPRKMYAALSALANRLGPNPKPVPLPGSRRALRAYLFDTSRGAVAIIWHRGENPPKLHLPADISAFDIMGNRLQEKTVSVTATPVYLAAPRVAPLRNYLGHR